MPDFTHFIYEAGMMPERWPELLGKLGRHFGAIGGLLFSNRLDDVKWTASESMVPAMHDFIAEGWMSQNIRIPRLMERRYPGFVCNADLLSLDEIGSLPMFTQFLAPRGLAAAAGTVIPGALGDTVVMSLEGFSSQQQSMDAKATLDIIRPHLARAAVLSAQLGLEKAKAAVAALQAIGAPAAAIGRRGGLRAANGLFQSLIGKTFSDYRIRLRLADARADKMFEQTLIKLLINSATGGSIPLRPQEEGTQPSVLHVVPVCGDARDIFTDIAALLVVAMVSAPQMPDGNLLQSLFDLTPAEARVASSIAGGATVAEAAAVLGLSRETIRTQLKSVFTKTGFRRQGELVASLGGLTMPGSAGNATAR